MSGKKDQENTMTFHETRNVGAAVAEPLLEDRAIVIFVFCAIISNEVAPENDEGCGSQLVGVHFIYTGGL